VSKWVLTVGGVVLLVAGALFALQGFDVIGGSAMSGSSVWKIIGPVIAIVGLVLIVLAARRARAA
jgi:drug/metabolite transporter superfamily protein YnfA